MHMFFAEYYNMLRFFQNACGTSNQGSVRNCLENLYDGKNGVFSSTIKNQETEIYPKKRCRSGREQPCNDLRYSTGDSPSMSERSPGNDETQNTQFGKLPVALKI